MGSAKLHGRKRRRSLVIVSKYFVETQNWSCSDSPLQRSLYSTLGCFPDHWQVVLSFACSVASLSLSPSHYLPGRPRLRRGVLADYLFGKGSPSTWCAGRTTVHGAPATTPPFGAQRGITLPRCKGRRPKTGQELTKHNGWLRLSSVSRGRGTTKPSCYVRIGWGHGAMVKASDL